MKKLAVLALGVFIVACAETPTETPTLAGDAALDGIPTASQEVSGQTALRYLVYASGSALPGNLDVLVARAGGTVLSTIPQIGVAVVEGGETFQGDIGRAPGIAGAIPDFIVPLPDFAADDSRIATSHATPGAGFAEGLLWGIDAVNAPEAWAAGNTGSGVRVAVLDAGIDHDHPDLVGNINEQLSTSFMPCLSGGFNCNGAYEDWRVRPGNYFNHGTHVSGTIAATGALGVTGVAPNAELVAVKVCSEHFNGCFTSAILAGLVHATDIGADLVNMSLGGTRRMRNDFVKYCTDLGLPPTLCASLVEQNRKAQADYVAQTITVYRRAFQYAANGGTTVITSAGNSGADFDGTRDIWAAFADFPQTIAVAATGPVGWCLDQGVDLDQPAYYTSFGQSIVDVAAPGGNFFGFFLGSPYRDECGPVPGVPAYAYDGIFSTVSGGWTWAQGTSMAAPHATGIAALLISANGAKMSPASVERALKAAAEDLGKPGHDDFYGAGRVTSGY